MMQIGQAAAVRATEPSRPATVASPGFRLAAEDPAGSRATGTGATRGLDALLALQEAGASVAADPGVRDREARRHGRALLEELAELQKSLLSGADEGASLERLAALLGRMPAAADPALASILRSVGLRARVELARQGLPDIDASRQE